MSDVERKKFYDQIPPLMHSMPHMYVFQMQMMQHQHGGHQHGPHCQHDHSHAHAAAHDHSHGHHHSHSQGGELGLAEMQKVRDGCPCLMSVLRYRCLLRGWELAAPAEHACICRSHSACAFVSSVL